MDGWSFIYKATTGIIKIWIKLYEHELKQKLKRFSAMAKVTLDGLSYHI